MCDANPVTLAQNLYQIFSLLPGRSCRLL